MTSGRRVTWREYQDFTREFHELALKVATIDGQLKIIALVAFTTAGGFVALLARTF